MGKLKPEYEEEYEFGTKLFWTLIKEMLDGKPICSPEDMGLLTLMICNTQGDHLEIGTAYGGTMLAALRAMDYCGRDDKVVCIEPFGEERRDTKHKAVEREFWRNVEHFGVADRIEHVKAFSHPFPINGNRGFATALIDGDHSYEYVLNDWLNTKKVVDCYIMFHDYNDKHKGVKKVVDDYVRTDKEWEVVVEHGWSAVAQKKSWHGNNA